VEALWGVGPVTAKKLRAIGIERLVDVRSADEEKLRRAVGSLAGWLRRLAQGDDPRQVTPDRPWKSISAEDTYPEDLRDLKEMRAEITRLARRVAASLDKKHLIARTVTIKVRYSDFTTVTRSHTDETPTCDARVVAERALALLERTEATKRPVRLLGVGTHGLLPRGELSNRPGTLPIFSS
jgi:DNA polymerase-4